MLISGSAFLQNVHGQELSFITQMGFDLANIAKHISEENFTDFDKGMISAYVNVLSSKGIDNESIQKLFTSVSSEFEKVGLFGLTASDAKSNQSELYVVMGYADTNENGNYEATFHGVFSTDELAREYGDELVECGCVDYYDIECPILDEFGMK